MRELQKRQEFKRFLYSIPSLAILVVIAFLLARGAASILTKERETRERLATLEEGNALLRERHAELEGKIERLQTEEGIIEEIRARFNAARAGEYLAIIVEETPSEAATTSPWYLKIWNAIIKPHE